MKAVVCRQYGSPDTLVIEEHASPQAGAGEVVISVRAAGVNFPDGLKVGGKHQLTPPVPFSPGHEVSGVIKEIGPDVHGYEPGDHVVAHLRNGGFMQEVLAKADHTLALIPKGVDFIAAAAFPLAYGTSFHALRRAGLARGETLMVLAASGGVGIAAVQLGKLLGARVVACASTADKLATCRQYGADVLINYDAEDLREAVKRVTGGRGVDVVVDPVGGKYAEPAVRSMAWKGRYAVVGFAAGAIPKIPLNLVLLKGCSIVGAAVASNAVRDSSEYRANLSQMIEWIAAGELKPVVTRTYRMEDTGAAIADVMSRKVHGKAVVVM